MRRTEIKMDLYDPGSRVSAHGDFIAGSTMDDLTYGGTGRRRFIASGSQESGRRVLLHSDAVTRLDQAVDAVIDRASPLRRGGDPLGLILCWQVAGTDSALAQCAEVGSESALEQIAATVIEDVTLGERNHIEVSIDGDTLRLIEAREVSDEVQYTDLFSMTIDSSIRRIALRAAHVQGSLCLWWDPSGLGEFTAPPIAQCHTALAGLGRPGMFAGVDGRFLSLAFTYHLVTLSAPIVLRSLESPDGLFVPMRAVCDCDESRPPMRTGFQVSHWGDTALPERAESESIVGLRDRRFVVRPGHNYRSRVWVRTVDDQFVSSLSRDATASGTLTEDLRLRDSEGRLVQEGQGADATDPEVSDIEIPVWPAEFKPSKKISTSLAPGRIDIGESMGNMARGVQRAILAPRTFNFPFKTTPAGHERFQAFRRHVKGRVSPFIWTNPITEETIVVRLFQDTIGLEGLEADSVEINVTFMEEPRPIEPATESPAAESYSGGGGGGGGGASSGGGDPGEGGCTFPTPTITVTLNPYCVCGTDGCDVPTSAGTRTLVLERVDDAGTCYIWEFREFDRVARATFCPSGDGHGKWTWDIPLPFWPGWDELTGEDECAEDCGYVAFPDAVGTLGCDLTASSFCKECNPCDDCTTQSVLIELCEEPLGECEFAVLVFSIRAACGSCDEQGVDKYYIACTAVR